MIAITFAYVVIGISAVVIIAVFLYWFFIARPEDREATEQKKIVNSDIRHHTIL